MPTFRRSVSWYENAAHVRHLEEPERFNRELAALTRQARAFIDIA